MPIAIRFAANGGPEVLRAEEFTPNPPAAHEVQLRQTAIGVNFIDVYDRSGLYPVQLPSGLGREAAGVVSALGRSVRGFRKGEHVAYVSSSPGAYASVRNVPADRLVKIPRGVSDEQAAAMMLKGLTAQFLLRRAYRVQRGDPILVHAAAGGVGLILCQWARALGAKVIGVVGTEAKAVIARRHGCRHVLISGRDDLVAGVKSLTRGAGVAAVYDAVGKDTFTQSLDCVRRLGIMISYGNASGPPPAIAPAELARRGSLFLTRPSLFNYIVTRDELTAGARELFAAVRGGKVRVVIGQRYPLQQAGDAHRELEGRRTTGSTVLVP
ncbi:MAG: quinone oxidoreductase [Proteobacteria bacterium]|nr:quinone oxidoreductase [Pseudomonadota bacterium]